MDRVVIYETKQGIKAKIYFYDCTSYKEIKKLLKKYPIKRILSVKKFKLCTSCNDGYLEVDDKRGRIY